MSLEILRAAVLGDVAHGFFTRAGGVSTGRYAGLNCGAGSGDAAQAVAENRNRVAAAMGGPLVSVRQVHSADVVTVTDADASVEQADAMVTARPGPVLTILTADCMPVLFHDPRAGVIGAAHAGWRGALAGVLEATVEAMVAAGARAADIRAAIGPSIGPRAYEVGPDFPAPFVEEDAAASAFFAPGEGDRRLFDLPGYGLHRLARGGVGARVRAEWTGHCTWSNPERFHSWRRTVQAGETGYGRLIAAIRL